MSRILRRFTLKRGRWFFLGAVVGAALAGGAVTLAAIVHDHADAAAASASAIRRLLAPILPRVAPSAPVAGQAWRDLAQGMPSDIQRLDQALNETAVPDDASARKTRAAQALADLDARVERLRAPLQP